MSGARAGRARVVPALVNVLLIAAGLFWLAGIFATYPQGEVVDGVIMPVLGDYWGFDIEAYLNAATRLGAEGSLYARALVEAPFTPGGYDYFYYAPPFGTALLPLTGQGIVDATATWYFLKVGALLAACLAMPVGMRTRALVFLGAALSYWVVRDLVLGNVGAFLLLPLTLAWRWLDRPLGFDHGRGGHLCSPQSGRHPNLAAAPSPLACGSLDHRGRPHPGRAQPAPRGHRGLPRLPHRHRQSPGARSGLREPRPRRNAR